MFESSNPPDLNGTKSYISSDHSTDFIAGHRRLEKQAEDNILKVGDLKNLLEETCKVGIERPRVLEPSEFG